MPHGPKLPIKLDSATNGEFAPVPVASTVAYARKIAAERIAGNARRLGQSRRQFMAGVCGAATTLLALNEAFAARGLRGGGFDLPSESAVEPEAAQALAGREFIFDIQTHFVEANGTAWRNGPVEGAKNFDVIGQMVAGLPPKACAAGRGTLQCYDADNYIKDVFLDSDTDLAVLSFVPALPGENPVSMKEAARVQGLVAALGQNRRLLLHAMIVPNVEDRKRELARMAEVHKEYNISAWKVYPQWGPKGVGWWLDDPEVGIPFIEEARRIGIKNICMHKGFAFPGNEPKFSSAEDVGRVAKKYPDMNFIVYHSGIEADRPEGAFDPAKADKGVDTLIKSLVDNEIPPNSNVYAELGSTWRLVMSKPDQAAHTLGKLIKHVGAKRVLWGSDSIWYGSPQDQIQAFRTFQISPEFQQRFGYAALTPEVKADIFGLNAAPIYGVDPEKSRRRGSLDPLGRMKAEYRHDPAPSFETLGPRNAAEWRRFRAVHGAGPG
jgi:predicted TIM-barrel fold metal-dependent hydrolase